MLWDRLQAFRAFGVLQLRFLNCVSDLGRGVLFIAPGRHGTSEAAQQVAVACCAFFSIRLRVAVGSILCKGYSQRFRGLTNVSCKHENEIQTRRLMFHKSEMLIQVAEL